MKKIFTLRLRRLALLLAICGWLIAPATAQTPIWEAAWTGGGAGAIWAFGTASDANGNVFACGRFAGANVAFGTFTLSNTATAAGVAAANQNGYLVKYGPSGTVLWAQQASVAGFSSFSSVATDATGNVYATGLYYGGALALGSTTLPAPAVGTRPGFVVKYDAQGVVQWTQVLNSSSFANGVSVATGAGGSVYVGGTFAGSFTAGSLPQLSTTSGSDQDPFLLKLDATGTPVWARQLVGNGATLQQDVGNAVAVDAAGNPALTGYFFSPTLVAGTTSLTNAAAGSADIFLAKYDAAGNVVWAQRAGGTSGDFGSGLTATANGNLYLAGQLGATGGIVAGTSFGANTSSGALLAGYSPSGAGQWALREGNGSSYNSVALDPGNNLVVAGSMSGTLAIGSQTLTSAGSSDILTARYTSAGAFIGAGRVGGNGNDFAYATCSDPANGQTVVGYTMSSNINLGGTTNLNSTGGTQDGLVIKYASTGALSFAKRISTGGGNEYVYGTAVDAQGNTYVAGTFGNNIRFDGTTLSSSSNSTVFVVKYSPSGAVLWARQLGTTAGQPASPTYSGGLALDAAGNLYVAGSFSGSLAVGSTTLTSTGGASDLDVFLVKYDAQGNPQWARAAGGTDFDEGTAVAVNAAGVVVVGGDSYSPSLTFGSQTVPVGANTPSVFVARYDAAGTAQWARAFPSGSNNDFGYVEALAVDAAGNVGLTGEFSGSLTIGSTALTTSGSYTVFAAKCTAAGVPQWARQAQGTACFPQGAVFDPAGNFAITGQMRGATTFGTFTLTPSATYGLFLVKYDAAGTVQWARQNSGTANSFGGGLAADGAGSFYVGGGYGGGTLTLGSITLPTSSLYRALVARYDGQGTPQWAVTTFSANTTNTVRSVAIGPAGSLTVAGIYSNFLQLTSTVLVQASESQGTDIFVARLAGAVPLATAAPRTALPALSLYPNPARGQATVLLPAGLAGQPLRLRDALGREVRRFATPAVGAADATLDLRGLPAGLYLLRAGEATGKLVIE